eukprot:4698001-Prymnesium_polylepis.1
MSAKLGHVSFIIRASLTRRRPQVRRMTHTHRGYRVLPQAHRTQFSLLLNPLSFLGNVAGGCCRRLMGFHVERLSTA